jgi:hypothetical protein
MDTTDPATPAPAQQLAARLKSQYTPAFLTLTSIIQGVAFTTLVGRVEPNAAHFTAADWLISAATFVGFVLIWHEYLMQALAFVWIPTLLDSLVPFAFLAAELFMAHLVYGNPRAWLLAAACAWAVGLAVWATNFTEARIPSSENRDLLAAVAAHLRPRFILNLALFLIYLLAWAGYDFLHLGDAPLAVGIVALLLHIFFLLNSSPYWNRVLAYARGEAPPAQAPRAHEAK